MNKQRRNFLKGAAALGAAALAIPSLLQGMPAAEWKPDEKGEGFTFLFQGDSITDGNRSRNNDWNHVMGHGYAYLIASRLGYDHPAKRFHFFNRGISGNKVPDLAQRWQIDTLDIKPDLLSILIGINDSSAALGGDASFTIGRYENEYRSLLERTRERLPAVQFILCEPFVLPVGKIKERWEEYVEDIGKRQEVVKRLSGEYNAIYIGLQDSFNSALSRAPADYWIWDGVHPMPAGHELIAREWIGQVGRRLKFIK
jgi:lysophospholipase L1-like esterase